MHKMKFYLPTLFLAMTLLSCQQNETANHKFFDMDSLVDRQLNYLKGAKASLTKSASIDNTRDQSTFTPDSTDWANELEVFRNLELINKPIYAEAYNITDGQKDVNSNLMVRSIIAKREVPIKFFKIYYQDAPHKIRKIEASLSEQNALYFTTRTFSIELNDVKGQMTLDKYSIQGVQKMILRDSVRFLISSHVNY